MRQGAGRIGVAGRDYEVTFTAADPAMNGEVDDAYRRKYGDSRYLEPMLSTRAQDATVSLAPRA
jgi:hypothetical protein